MRTPADVNNAFIAYRKAYEFSMHPRMVNTAVPSQLRKDLLRTAEALHFTQRMAEYRSVFPDTKWRPVGAATIRSSCRDQL